MIATIKIARKLNMTSTLLQAFVMNIVAFASSIWAAGQIGGAPTLNGETLVPLAVVAVLVGAAVKATMKVGKFIDRVDRLHERIGTIEDHLKLSPKDKRK